jgi:hypothetical protein
MSYRIYYRIVLLTSKLYHTRGNGMWYMYKIWLERWKVYYRHSRDRDEIGSSDWKFI